MARYIFSIGLIPVQEFISEARRSRDLRTSSAILSWLTSRVLVKLIDEHNGILLIPHHNSIDPFRTKKFSDILGTVGYSFPNRATGTIEADDIGSAKAVFEKLQEESLESDWKKIFLEAFRDNPILRIPARNEKEMISRRQMFAQPPACPIQLLWVLNGLFDENIDVSAIQEVKNRFDDIKRTRPIKPWSEGKEIGKCDQCGKRETLSPVDRFNEWRDWQELLSKQPWVKRGIFFERTERLCLICLTKRFAAYLNKSMQSFPSTSQIATREWRSQIKGSNFHPILDDIEFQLKALSTNHFTDPESLFYRRSLQKQEAELSELPHLAQTQFRELKQKIVKLKEAIKAHGKLKSEPSNYLAVLLFDGDGMGKAITEHWKDLPQKLVAFSMAIIAKYHGQNSGKSAEAFYVGGDEGLILAPIDTVLETAIYIKNTFQASIANKTTLSMGITIFDRQRPLGGAIRLARQALEKSKAVEIEGEKKNALTITVQTASGNEFSVTARWGKSWQRTTNALKLIQGDDGNRKLSVGWAYEVENFLQSLPDEWSKAEFQSAAAHEVKRITLRKLAVRHGSPQEKKACRLATWEKDLLGSEWFLDTGANFAETTSNQLHLIAFLARESAYQSEYAEERIEGE